MTDRPTDIDWDEAIIINRAELPCPHEAEVQALRDRVRKAEAWNDALLVEVDKLKAELEAQHD